LKETEQALIGAMIGDPSCIPSVIGIVKASDMETEKGYFAFEAIEELFREGAAIDPVTVGTSPGVDFLYVTSSTSIGFWTSATQYAVEIATASKIRRMKDGLNNLISCKKAEDILRGITDIYNNESGGKGKEPEIVDVIGRFDAHVKANIARGSTGLATGIQRLDNSMIYYVSGQIWALGGYTSTGKTAMMVQMIVNLFMANKKARVCVIATEMTEEQMVARILGNMTGIYSQRILAGDVWPTDQEKYSKAYSQLKSWNLKIHDDINELADIESTARSHAMRGGIDVCFIDYVQNCHVKGIDNSYMEQKTLATNIQQLAKTTNSTMVCLSQVSNAVGRGDVGTFELKGAGEWAAVADVGMMLKRGKIDERELLLDVPKNRHGVKPSVIFKFSKNYSNMVEIPEDSPI